MSDFDDLKGGRFLSYCKSCDSNEMVEYLGLFTERYNLDPDKYPEFVGKHDVTCDRCGSTTSYMVDDLDFLKK